MSLYRDIHVARIALSRYKWRSTNSATTSRFPVRERSNYMIDTTTTPSCPPQGGNFIGRLAVVGDPISHSLSPVLQSFLIAQFNLPFVYQALRVRAEDLPQLIARLRNGELAGVNVTLPHKQVLMPLLDELVYPANRIGAVNTVRVVNGKLLGHNTDALGFSRSLECAQIAVRDEQVLLLGAGGAAKAVVFALLEAGVEVIHLANRNTERAAQLRASLSANEQTRVRVIAWEERERVLQSHALKLVINATSLGMSAAQAAAPLNYFKKEVAAVDLIYNPNETLFLQQAKRAGAITLNGLPMLIHQGVAAMELWSGRKLEIKAVYGKLEAKLTEAIS